MDYYTLNKDKNKFATGTAPQPIAGRPFQPGAPSSNASDKFGHLSVQGLPMGGGSGTGIQFQLGAKTGSLDAVKGGMSTANPADYAAMDQTRGLLQNQLANVPGNVSAAQSAIGTKSQQGLTALLRQHKAANAGTGLVGTRQFAGQQGDITSRIADEYMNAMREAENEGIKNSLLLSEGLGGLYNRDLTERQFQFGQGSTLSDVIQNLYQLDQARESGLMQRDMANQANKAAMIGGGLGMIGQAAGGYLGGIGQGAGLAAALKKQMEES